MDGTILLVRHAVPHVPEAGGPDDHHRDLTEDGRRQAEALAAMLPRPARIVSSPYLRAVRTVEPLARAYGMDVETDHELREWESGLEPTPDFARHYAASWADPAMARPGGESLQQLSARATAALGGLGGVVVVGSHGTFIARALVGFGVRGVDWPFAAAMPMPAVYELRFTRSGVVATGPGL